MQLVPLPQRSIDRPLKIRDITGRVVVSGFAVENGGRQNSCVGGDHRHFAGVRLESDASLGLNARVGIPGDLEIITPVKFSLEWLDDYGGE